MKVVVTGLSSREEAAFGMFLGRFMSHWAWQSAVVTRGAVLPQADLIVANLVPLGLGQWSETAEADLLRLLHGTPAVLLVPSHDRTWASMNPATVAQHSLVWLTKPHGTKEMQAALEEAQAFIKRPPHLATPPAVVATRAPPAPSVPAPVAPVVAASKTEDAAAGITAATLQTQLAAQPDAGRHVFLRQLSAMLALKQPFEVRFTVQNSLIVHPTDGWAASNTPMLVIKRVCQSDSLATVLEIRAIDGAQAEERVGRLGMRLRELDAVLGELTLTTLDR